MDDLRATLRPHVPGVNVLCRIGNACFDERVVAFAERNVDLGPADREILRALDMSIDQLRSDRVSFATGPNKLQLGKRAQAILGFGTTSPMNDFSGSGWNQ